MRQKIKAGTKALCKEGKGRGTNRRMGRGVRAKREWRREGENGSAWDCVRGIRVRMRRIANLHVKGRCAGGREARRETIRKERNGLGRSGEREK